MILFLVRTFQICVSRSFPRKIAFSMPMAPCEQELNKFGQYLFYVHYNKHILNDIKKWAKSRSGDCEGIVWNATSSSKIQ